MTALRRSEIQNAEHLRKLDAIREWLGEGRWEIINGGIERGLQTGVVERLNPFVVEPPRGEIVNPHVQPDAPEPKPDFKEMCETLRLLALPK